MTAYQILCLCGIQALVTAVIGALVGVIVSKIQKNNSARLALAADTKVVKTAMCDIIRDRLYRMYLEASQRGTISYEEQQNFNHLYESYKALGGNSYILELYDKYLDIPFK